MSDVRRAAYLLNLLLLLAAAAALGGRGAASSAAAGRPPTPQAPARVGAWVSQGDQALPEGAREVLAAATVVNREYAASAGTEGAASAPPAPIGFTVIGGTDRSTLHDPRSCFVGAGWRIDNDHVESLPGGAGEPMVRVCRVVREADAGAAGGAAAGPAAYDVLYFYLVGGKAVSDVTRIRAEMLWSAVVGRRDRTVYFLRFVQPAAPAAAPPAPAGQGQDAGLRGFAAAMWQDIGPQLLRAEGTS